MAFNRGPGGSQSGASDIEDTPVTIAQGGTSATTAAQARTNLGIGTMGTQPSNSVSITGGTITGITPLPVASGGTGASGQAEARANLGISTAATQDTEYFATAAQGTLADSAVQPGDLATVATTGAYSDLSGTPSLATVATSGSYNDLSDKPSIPVNLDDLGDVVITTPANNEVLAYNGTNWVNAAAGAGSGTVTSVDMTVPTGLAVSGNPITTNGTLAVTYSTGYAIPTTSKQTNWDTAYGWGDHSVAGYLDSADIGVTVQGYDIDTAKYDDVTANFTGTLQNGGHTVLTTASDYLDSADIGVSVQGYDVDTAKYDDVTANFTGTLQNGGSNVVVDSDIGSTVQAYDSNLTSFVSTFTLPTTDGTNGQILTTNGTGTLSFNTVSGGQYLGTAATKAIMYNAQSIAEDITISGTYNALSAGPITIDSTYTVTVSSGAVWTIV